MQKHVNLVDLVKSFPTNIYLQNLASIQKRTSPVKYAHLAEKSGKGSISNLSTKARAAPPIPATGCAASARLEPFDFAEDFQMDIVQGVICTEIRSFRIINKSDVISAARPGIFY